MAINFPDSPTNGQTYTDSGTGQTWTYELATNSWTASSLAVTGGVVYKGSVDITAAPPTGAKAGEQWSVGTGGTANAGYGPGVTGTITKGGMVMYTGTGWLEVSHSVPDATTVAKGIDTQKWNRAGTVLSPATAGDVVNISAGTAALPGLTPVGDPDSGLFSPGADQIAVSTGGVGRLFVNASGNIGVGAAPTTRLEVSRQGGAWPGVAPISGTALFVHSGSASTTSTARLSILGGSASEASIHFGDTDNSSEAIIKLDNTSDSLRFEVNGSERLRIDGNGRLLAGTSSAFPVR